MDKLKMHSPDFVEANIAQVASLFPGCVTEAAGEDGSPKRAIDFDFLRQELSPAIVEGPRECYHLNWPGKQAAMLAAIIPVAKSLRPCREESVDFDATGNLFIEGDNLDAMKMLQRAYLGKVKMIYIDPPYNTGKDFIYKDKFAVESGNWKMADGEYAGNGDRLVANPESNARFHSDWLTMMYPRLRLARNLLREDGVIVAHVDWHEYANMEKMLNEALGEANKLGVIVWDKRNPKGDAAGVSQRHELIILFGKNREHLKRSSKFKLPSLLYCGGGDAKLLSELGVWFDAPKPVSVSKQLISPILKDGDTLLDLFAGSATSAHAVMQLNAEDGGQRKFIMVQLPERCREKSRAFKAGFRTVAEIGRERIRRAGKKIKDDNGAAASLDVGFRLLKLDSSNMIDAYYTATSLQQEQIHSLTDYIKADRTDEDLLFQILFNWGVALTSPITRESILGREVFFVNGGELAACLVKNGELSIDFCKELAERKPRRAVFCDGGFKDDCAVFNNEQIFNVISPHTEVRTV